MKDRSEMPSSSETVADHSGASATRSSENSSTPHSLTDLALFRRMTENAQDMINRMSVAEAKYEYVNPEAIDLTGYTPEIVELKTP